MRSDRPRRHSTTTMIAAVIAGTLLLWALILSLVAAGGALVTANAVAAIAGLGLVWLRQHV